VSTINGVIVGFQNFAWTTYGKYEPIFREIGAYFPEVFQEIRAYFPEVVKMAMLQKGHVRQPSQGWCGRQAARIFC
jgi:hypothetical protein